MTRRNGHAPMQVNAAPESFQDISTTKDRNDFSQFLRCWASSFSADRQADRGSESDRPRPIGGKARGRHFDPRAQGLYVRDLRQNIESTNDPMVR